MLTVFRAPLTCKLKNFNDAFYLLQIHLFESANFFFWWSLSCRATRDRSVPKWSIPPDHSPPDFSLLLPWLPTAVNLKISASQWNQSKGKKSFNHQILINVFSSYSSLFSNQSLSSATNAFKFPQNVSLSENWCQRRLPMFSFSELKSPFWTMGRIYFVILVALLIS
jgi:hypothetical protein